MAPPRGGRAATATGDPCGEEGRSPLGEQGRNPRGETGRKPLGDTGLADATALFATEANVAQGADVWRKPLGDIGLAFDSPLSTIALVSPHDKLHGVTEHIRGLPGSARDGHVGKVVGDAIEVLC